MGNNIESGCDNIDDDWDIVKDMDEVLKGSNAVPIKATHLDTVNRSPTLPQQVGKDLEDKFDMRTAPSRTVIMLDATGSMNKLLAKVKLSIKEILSRLHEITRESTGDGTSFAIQFVIYRNYNAAKVVESSEWLSDGSLLNDFLEKVKIDGGYGREAIEMGLAHCNWQISEGKKPTQILLIGDSGPNQRDEVVFRRSRHDRNSLTGEEYYKTCGSYFTSATYWEDELSKISTHNIPVHAYYLPQNNGSYPAKTDFEEIARRTVGGSSAELLVDETHGGGNNAELIGTLAIKVLTDIQNNSGEHAGGQSLVEKYVQKYGAFRGYVRG